MAGNSSITTENFLRLSFTPKSGITPGTNDTIAMSCDQIIARYSVTISGGTSTGLRLPAQNELTAIALSPPVFSELSFPNGRTSSKIIVRSNFSSGLAVTARGLWYNTTGPTPTGTQVVLANTAGQIDTNVTGLAAGTNYYFTCYCTNADGTTTYSFASAISTLPAEILFVNTSGMYTVPSGCISLTVECIGSGGGGGTATGIGSRAGGGSGGAYAKAVIAVTPGQSIGSYWTTVGGVGGSNGADSYFGSYCRASGGTVGATASGTTSAGGVAQSVGSVGTTIYKGGNGGAGTASGASGGGGGGAGSTGVGNNASLGTAGAAKSLNGGAGGAGITTDGAKNAGGSYGAGGSGGLATTTTDRSGGSGGNGLIRITFP